ncbi:MAG: sodium:proton antiporter [Caulobacteraceae bacterium]
MLTIYELAALILSLAALFGWINRRFFNLPHTIGLLIMALGTALLMAGVEAATPGVDISASLRIAVAQIDFHDAIMNGMLAFLLFAGALHVNLSQLAKQKWAIALLASVGVIISTLVIGLVLWAAAPLLGLRLPWLWALVFGALISPTDPVAVLGLLKTVKVPEALKSKIAGEALFNDGVAVVAFTVLVAAASASSAHGADPLSLPHVGWLFLLEGVGAIVFGLVMGWIAHQAMKAIDDHAVEILITLALCIATYVICMRLNLSGPIAVVVAGLLIGNHDVEEAMSEKVHRYLFSFWEVVDDVFNSVLFLLIGLEVLVLSFHLGNAALALVAIPAALLGRFVSLGIPIVGLSRLQTFDRGVIPTMTWGGLRGGVSVALALSLPDTEVKPLLLTCAYAVTVFSIVAQGLSFKQVVRRTIPQSVTAAAVAEAEGASATRH